MDFKKIESKWQKKWQEAKSFAAKDFDEKPKYYILEEFPYCSGKGLHIGHAFTNVIGDILARKKRMDGFNVLHPMGWDSFGLPTENSAIKTGIQPAVLTARNTKRFHQQNDRLAISYDWSREIDTSHPDYYKWTQWLFLQFFKHDLAYKAETPVGWCPSCKIILANEEIVSGNCERCGHEAEYRRQSQWLLKITAYADRLADELDLVDYPDYVKKSQRDWIGRSEGVQITFKTSQTELAITVFTTAVDTIFGTTFMVVSPEVARGYLPFIVEDKRLSVSNYIENSLKKSDMERQLLEDKTKTGIDTGIKAINPFNGKEIPVFVADYVLANYGTGAVMGVPGHDARDHEFAKKYDLEVIRVLKPSFEGPAAIGRQSDDFWDYSEIKEKYCDQAVLFNSASFDGLTSKEAKTRLEQELVKGGVGKKTVNYHLRDWVFSRQHYWGEPIPIVHCLKCGMVPVPDDQLPVRLPEVEKYQPTDTGESPLANVADWVNTTCPSCGGPAKRETDTMPNWAGSSWYYLAFCLVDKLKGSKNIFSENKKVLEYWTPVDLYLGGAEHTTLHLLYSRFWHKFLNDIGLVPGKEPYAVRRQHGVILGEDGSRMSKSRGNIINPDETIEKFGADTLRLYLMFMGPYDSNAMPWNSKGLEGSWRFLNRVWKIYLDDKKIGQETSGELLVKLHKTIKKVGLGIDVLKHNTAIAALMEFLNDWSAQGILSTKDAGVYLQLLAPFAPYLAEELWEKIGGQGSVHVSSWPTVDERYLVEDNVEVVVQVLGKVRGKVTVDLNQAQNEKEVTALAQKEVAKYLEGKQIIKTIFVPGRLVNFVVG